MVNIINELEQRNKNLLEENEVLKKQLVDKEEISKLKIYNAIHNVMENESPEIAGTLMTLQQHFWSWDEWVKVQEENGVEKVNLVMNSLLKTLLKVLQSEHYLVVILSVMFPNKIRNLKKGMLS